MFHLSNVDREQIGVAEAAGVLPELDGDRIKRGSIFVTCADGDQFRSVHDGLCLVSETSRHHPLSLNGGALLMAPMSAGDIPDAGIDGDVLLRHINQANQIKRIPSVVLCSHAPCGVAYGFGLDFFEVLRRMIEAKRRVRLALGFNDVEKVLCLLHIDYGEGVKKLHRIRKEKTVKFLEEQGRSVRF